MSDAAALEEADALLLATPERPADPARANELYNAAAARGGGAAAARAATLAAYGFGRAQNWSEALDLLAQAAELGDVAAARQLALLAGAPADGAPKPEADRWRGRINIERLLSPAPLQRLSHQSAVGVSRGFAPPGFSAWLIEHGRNRLEPAVVNDAVSGELRRHEMRTALHCAFGPQQRDVIVAVMQARAARISGIPLHQHEAPNLISYEPGQQFGMHVDFIDPELPEFQRELNLLGQRVITFVTYLNDDFDGGATHFPALGVSFRGREGDAIVFSNVKPDGGPDRLTAHAGLPPTSGRKWVLSQWLRDRRQPYN